MKRSMLVLVVAVLAVVGPLSQSAFGGPVDTLWEKLFGCEGKVPISCPGPNPW